jgi:hypothetical protein
MNQMRRTTSRGWAIGLITPFVLLTSTVLFADDPPKKPEIHPAPARSAVTPHAATPAAVHPGGAAGAAAGAASHVPGIRHPNNQPAHTGTPSETPANGTHIPGNVTGGRQGGVTSGNTGGNRQGGVTSGNTGGNRLGGFGGNNGTGARANASGFRTPAKVEPGHNGTQFQRDTRGQVREIHRGDLAVHRGPAGSFRSERARPDGSRLVGYRNGGYVEHSYRYAGHDVYRRNYYYGGRTYSRFYNPYSYRGVAISVYAPSAYYSPGFYGYAYAPWGAPVVYSWGWNSRPWYGYYGGYFTPYPSYSSPSLWLTDYLVAQSLENAYQQQQTAGQQQQAGYQQQGMYDNNSSQAPAPLTPEVKQQIAEEVRRQIALENSERQNAGGANSMPDPASSGIARMMSDNTPHVFVVSAPLNLVSATGECAITEGDVLQMQGAPANDATSATAVVLASKGQDCARGSSVQVAFADLQEMQNHMRETLDQGLAELQKKQGTGGLPSLPPAAATAPTQAGFATIAPPPEPTEATDITRQIQDSSQAEQDALSTALSGPNDNSAPTAPPSTTATVSLGQSTAEVESIMGKPKSIATLPTKTIYVYDGLKVVFVNGKVSDVQ